MKIPAFFALAGLASAFTLRALAQSTDTFLTEQDHQQIDALGSKYVEAFNKNNAAALAALFTDDGLLVGPGSIVSGQAAIEKSYQDTFKGGTQSDQRIQTVELHGLGTDLALAAGQWSNKGPGPDNTVQENHGNWGAVDARVGDTWKIRMLTYNVVPPPPPAAEDEMDEK